MPQRVPISPQWRMNFCWIGLRFGIVNSLISVYSEITLLLANTQVNKLVVVKPARHCVAPTQREETAEMQRSAEVGREDKVLPGRGKMAREWGQEDEEQWQDMRRKILGSNDQLPITKRLARMLIHRHVK